MNEYNFEVRTTEFAKRIILLCRNIPQDAVNERLIKQIVGSSGSVGANYREANDSLGYNDFVYRLKISRKEAKETLHWLELITTANPTRSKGIDLLEKECFEIIKILSSMIGNAVKNHNKTTA